MSFKVGDEVYFLNLENNWVKGYSHGFPQYENIQTQKASIGVVSDVLTSASSGSEALYILVGETYTLYPSDNGARKLGLRTVSKTVLAPTADVRTGKPKFDFALSKMAVVEEW
jgi:hypothetical protein